MSGLITKKTAEEIRVLRRGGRILSRTLKALSGRVKVGVTLRELDKIAEDLLKKYGAIASFKGYAPHRGSLPFPGTICTSVNFTVVHGIPKDKPLKDGDVISLDLGVRYKDLYVDGAITVGVGKIKPEASKLIRVTREALAAGTREAKIGKTTGDIGYVVQRYVEHRGFSIIRELVGHGVGYDVHEAPYIPNFGSPSSGVRLEVGMVIAIEPMVAAGSGAVEMFPDGSFVTKDRSLAAHFEHTLAITDRGPLILTR